MNKGAYIYNHPRPAVTTDCVVFGNGSESSDLAYSRLVMRFGSCDHVNYMLKGSHTEEV